MTYEQPSQLAVISGVFVILGIIYCLCKRYIFFISFAIAILFLSSYLYTKN